MLPRPLYFMIRFLAWMSIPVVPLWLTTPLWASDKGEMIATGGVVICVLCALNLWREGRVREYRKGDDARQAALIRALAKATGTGTGPHRIAEPDPTRMRVVS